MTVLPLSKATLSAASPAPSGAVARALGDVLVEARGVGATKGGKAVLEHVDLAVREGEIVTLIGPNGAGKTTLARLILGLEPPGTGRIVRAQGLTIGYVPQRFAFDRAIPLTVRRFLTLGVPAEPGAVLQALEEVGAGGLVERQIAALSGGEFQRVALARALVRSPRLLVLDEPVQGVDFQGEGQLYMLIGTIRDRRRCGVLLISHDLHVVMGASDRVVCLNHHVCCQGMPQAVAGHPEYLRLFGPAAASAFALYTHAHDHTHDLSGSVASQQGHPHDHHH